MYISNKVLTKAMQDRNVIETSTETPNSIATLLVNPFYARGYEMLNKLG